MRIKNKLFIIPIIIVVFTMLFLTEQNMIKGFASEILESEENLVETESDISTNSIIITLTSEETRKFKAYGAEDFSDIGCISVEEITESTMEYAKAKAYNRAVEQSVLIDYSNYKRILKLEIPETNKESIYNIIDQLSERTDIYAATPN